MALQYVAQNRMYLSPFGCESWAHRAYFKITSACGPDPGSGCSRRWTRRGPAWQRRAHAQLSGVGSPLITPQQS